MVLGLHVPILSGECADSVSAMSASTLPSIFITFIWKNRKCLTSCQLFTFYFCPIWEFSYYCFGITITGSSMNEKNWFYSHSISEIISTFSIFILSPSVFKPCSEPEKGLYWSVYQMFPVIFQCWLRCSDTLEPGQWGQAGADSIETLTAPSWLFHYYILSILTFTL